VKNIPAFLRSLNLFRSSDRAGKTSGRQKACDRILVAIGPSWQAAPIRRLLQTAFLLLYLYLFFVVSWPYAILLSSQIPTGKPWTIVELFLWLDPLVGLSTAIAARWWNIALLGAGAVLSLGLLFPRVFCGYLCPMGTLIDLFDFLIARRIPWFKSALSPRWAAVRFCILTAVLAASFGGVLLSGFAAAIPVLTRGLLFSAGNVQLGLAKNWGMVPPMSVAMGLSLGLFAAAFFLSLIGPRFWCRFVCPSGALLSVAGLGSRFQRQVGNRCVQCQHCVRVCSFGAVAADCATRPLNCAFCQTCGGACPQQAIDFAWISTSVPGKKSKATDPLVVTRRTMLGSVAGGLAAALLTRQTAVAAPPPLRPPGSVPEGPFLDLCIRCEQCLKVCPGPVLQPAGWEYGLEALWTPRAVFSHAGCHPECNFCTQVCPTGAIQPLDLAQKRRCQIGLAILDTSLCLPHRGERDCQLCFDECNAAGYRAIEMRPIQLATGTVPEGMFSPEQIEQMSRILAPFVKADACVGCGLCEYRCHAAWVSRQPLLPQSAVMIQPVTAIVRKPEPRRQDDSVSTP